MIGIKSKAPELKVDNQAAIALSKNPVFHDRSKHIDTKFHFIRECLDREQIVPRHILQRSSSWWTFNFDQTAQKDAVPEAVFSDRHQASWRDQGLGGGMLHTPALACPIKFQLVQLTRVHDPEISEGCACLQELSTHVASTSCTERAWSWDGAAAMVFMPHI